MPSLGIKPTSIALFPTAADRSTLIPNTQQQHYLSPPLTPYPHFASYCEKPERTSPPVSSDHSVLPAFREMLPHETPEQKSPAHNKSNIYQHSALQQSSERVSNGTAQHNSVSTYHNGQHITDPTRLMPLYSTPSHTRTPQTSTIVPPPLLRRNKAHVASACVNCKKAHLACDGNSPPLFLFCQSMDPFPLILLYHACDQAALPHNVDACQAMITRSSRISGFFWNRKFGIDWTGGEGIRRDNEEQFVPILYFF